MAARSMPISRTSPERALREPREGPEAQKGQRLRAEGCIIRRMPRMQVYLPADLYKLVKTRRLRASELLQQAVRAEVRRQALLSKGDKYLADLVTEVGEPDARERARASAVAQRIARRTRRKVG